MKFGVVILQNLFVIYKKNMSPIIAVLITCHNRKEKTLSCIQALFDQKGLGEEFTIEVFLVDDASTDGTSEALRIQYPEVNIIYGNGNLYWNSGMHLAWKTAYTVKDFDYYLWLNDDVVFFKYAFSILLKQVYPNSIICGNTQSEISKVVTYGGQSQKLKKLIVPNGNYQHCDYFVGNCIMIPRIVFKRLGNLDPFYQHAFGDIDYSLRALKSGIEMLVAPEFIGTCERNSGAQIWYSSSYKLKDRFKYLYSPLCYFHPVQFFYFDKKHKGLFIACYHYLTVHLKCVFPSLWKFLKK